MRKIEYSPIGIIRSPHKKPEGTPIQPTAAMGYKGEVEVFSDYVDGLKDLDGFSHIYLIYHFHLIKRSRLRCVPFLDDKERGIFSVRGPARPNPIGFSVVKLMGIEDNILHVGDIDVVDGTPLLDIKPYVNEYDARKDTRIGWLEKNIDRLQGSEDDGRFLD
ncbi:tRNA (N6-threonylcarbamoyladenosine(37)-N6)-methyltransferase TrmO [Natranaerofaba carboxydovora]|uniref:tRNA (N6-threonylcarbamoyladenosine(37)-N6)-methyltransferase TrmO n=1 Tax=Natranaerofaba carboxydovora TaxID=2742683 RepID=UPI001F12D0B6|nr:tRNA (N6-threonylcarbamoyladenosine(37)-N6)-methyltransferase TrmO [Natranaerofaba carboxydovora]UMZ74462.1 tRNA (adenine(37)-N6)-methyltransferase [Natranaerofaba carboxydovora]